MTTDKKTIDVLAISPESFADEEILTHYTDLEGFNNIAKSARLLAFTEGRVYFSNGKKTRSISRKNEYKIIVTGPLSVRGHPYLWLPSLWGLIKIRQRVTPTGFDIQLDNMKISKEQKTIEATGTLIQTPTLRKYIGFSRRLYRYLMLDVVLCYGFLFISFAYYLPLLNINRFIVLIRYWAYSLLILTLIAALWCLLHRRVHKYLLFGETQNCPTASCGRSIPANETSKQAAAAVPVSPYSVSLQYSSSTDQVNAGLVLMDFREKHHSHGPSYEINFDSGAIIIILFSPKMTTEQIAKILLLCPP